MTNALNKSLTQEKLTEQTANAVTDRINGCRFGVAVRNGRCGSDPRLVHEFIRSQTLASSELPRDQQWVTQAAITKLLFETVADTLIAGCWRNWCLQCCCMPLHALRCLNLTPDELESTKKLESEMNMLKQYYITATH